MIHPGQRCTVLLYPGARPHPAIVVSVRSLIRVRLLVTGEEVRFNRDGSEHTRSVIRARLEVVRPARRAA